MSIRFSTFLTRSTVGRSALLTTVLLFLYGCSGSSDGGAQTPVPDNGVTATSLTATHRSGQTFLIWPESADASGYHIYRHTAPINDNTLPDATRLTGKWGSLGTDTSVNRYGSDNGPGNFVIQDLGTPLSSNTGLFVYTIPAGGQGSYYYAVTRIVNGDEQTIEPGDSTTSAVNESQGTPQPVLVESINAGKGRIYLQYRDYDNWNPTLNGYAYEFAVTLPFNYNPAQSYPLQLVLHAFQEPYPFLESSEFDWEIIQLRPHDPGPVEGTVHSWWYGYASDHNFEATSLAPSQGTVTNFTEQRVLDAVRFVQSSSEFNTNNQLTHIVGNSMGASGAVSLGLRYPNVFSGVYASQPMMNYASSPTFQENFEKIWGVQGSNLPIVNAGADAGTISRFSQGQGDETGVWDWMNHLQQIERRSSDDFAYLMIDHGKLDETIDWQTQGQPLVSTLTNAKAGFSANAFGDAAHIWLAFGAVVKPMFGLGFDTLAPWRYPLSLSYPAIHNASGSSSVSPGPTGDDSYNTTIEWATPAHAFGDSIVDTASQWTITLRSTEADQTADITPRRTQSFNPSAGQQCSWSATRIDNGQTTNGTATVAGNGLITITNSPIYSGSGTRLAINC
jgi:pimeloyl-ACP methyl ester carboxylesterase